uniref:Uncharacterized protein n=1 Tax=Rhizophora mucronata TaxID=61149 RepID=A0A2P2QJU6_RHIMU
MHYKMFLLCRDEFDLFAS